MEGNKNLAEQVAALELGSTITNQVTTALMAGDHALARSLLINVRGIFLINILAVGRERFSRLNSLIDALK